MRRKTLSLLDAINVKTNKQIHSNGAPSATVRDGPRLSASVCWNGGIDARGIDDDDDVDADVDIGDG